MLLCLSDLHNTNIIDKLNNLEWEDFDAVFFAGDFGSNQTIANEFLDYLFSKNLPVYAVTGNNDPNYIYDLISKKNCNLEEKEMTYRGWRVVGLGGSPIGPFNTINEFTDEVATAKLGKFNIDSNTIILSHSPPYGVLDKNNMDASIGSHPLLNFIEEYNPFAVFCGHTHSEGRVKIFQNTHVINIPALCNSKAMAVRFPGKPEDLNEIPKPDLKIGYHILDL
ncbi:metallophosphoesterase family protein [Candidatus Micrarchaeota archaeon]|nr:metallophosphoesterase family protein [Candidatus Micrarchaeota archaeon]